MTTNKIIIKVNLKQIRNEENYEKYFCQSCLQYPKYIIEIHKGTIFLSHKCIENKEVKIDLTKIKRINSKSTNKFCKNCKRIASNICLKCGQFICDQCILDHESINNIYSETVCFLYLIPSIIANNI